MADLSKVIDAVWDGVQQQVQSSGGELISSFKDSPQFQEVLVEVEARAKVAVVEETKKNAMTLFLLAMAGGAIGGTVFRGGFGLLAAGGISLWAASRLGMLDNIDSANLQKKIEEQIRDSIRQAQGGPPKKRLPPS
jgi:hypothetical protein